LEEFFNVEFKGGPKGVKTGCKGEKISFFSCRNFGGCWKWKEEVEKKVLRSGHKRERNGKRLELTYVGVVGAEKTGEKRERNGNKITC